jgi:hypothetical protein
MTGDKDKSCRNTFRVTFRVCSVDGIALPQEQCHQRFAMLSGASITHTTVLIILYSLSEL